MNDVETGGDSGNCVAGKALEMVQAVEEVANV